MGGGECAQGLTIIILIPKKGNLEACDNWRGIALLDVVGKVLDLFRIACVRWRRRSYLNPSVAFGRAVDALT